MQIKDLAKELSHEERALRGGAGNVAVIGGNTAANAVGGFDFGPQINIQTGSVVTQTYAPVNLDLTTVTQTITKNDIASFADSPLAYAAQM